MNAVSELGSEQFSFSHQLDLSLMKKQGGWLALRAKGKDYALAHSGIIYLENEQGSNLCKNEAPEIIDKMLSRLSTLEHAKFDTNRELEYWEAERLEQSYNEQKPALVEQITKAKDYYLSLKISL